MEHILDLSKQKADLHDIFKKVRESNTILFLGAGASVGEKKYLSKELIHYYEAYLGRTINELDITAFVDILSADDSFSRSHFDSFVADILKKYKVTEAHKILASIPWREIITTNYDLLVEQAYDAIENTSKKIYDLVPIKSLKQLSYRESATEVKYIKLNGCIQDISLYPLSFSTDDFLRLKSFYKNVLNDLKNLSPAIQFLSIGYSFSDSFGKSLLEKFDDFHYRDKKWLINVDPYPNENALAYYKKNKICIVKCSFEDFFLAYDAWEQNQGDVLVKKKGLSIVNSSNQYISFSNKLLLNIDGVVRQLNQANSQKEKVIKEADFYKGEEPNFNVVVRGLDVVKGTQISKFRGEILDEVAKNSGTLLPIFFIAGDFGIGKSTFTLRLILELEKDPDLDLVAFEILDFERLHRSSLIELISTCKSKNFVLYCDEVEVESYFKALLDLQRDLSIEQIQGVNIFFVIPIRENILEKFKLGRTIPRSYFLNLDGAFEDNEIDDLLERLKSAGLVNYRDAAEKKVLANRIKHDYNSDSFISLMAIITSGKHENDLMDSYSQLSPDARKAFLYTALLHRHKLWMPASWLKQNISMDWDEFTAKVIRAEGKGILIQDYKESHSTQPDIYFRTKHPIIASKLVERIVPNKDKQFEFYDRMLRTIEAGQTNSYLAINLLKAFIGSEEYSDFQLNKLFDAGYTKLSDDPYYLLNYAINLQHRKTINELGRALDLLIYAEGLLERRNHKFIHRRGVISFELAKLHYEDDNTLSQVGYYLNEAKDLFVTKQLLDPCSAYSYVDYIKMLIWELNRIEQDEEGEVQKQIVIEDLFELADRTVNDGIERIDNLRSSYASYLKNFSNNVDYKEHLDNMYLQFRLKPYACILLYNYYFNHQNWDECNKLIDEMEYYQENFEIVKFLFKYYGRNLYEPNIRIKFFRLSRNNPLIEKDNPLRFNYFNFVAETYNYQFNEGRRYLNNIQSRFTNLNPEFDHVWCDSEGAPSIFHAKVIKNTGERFKAIKISSMQQTVRLKKGNYDKYVLGGSVDVRLHFYLYGLMAEIVEG